MVARTPTEGVTGDIVTYVCHVYEVQMSTNDTVTLAEFTSSSDISYYKGIRKDTLAEVTFTVANNVLTITTAGLTNINVIIFAAGTKAV